MKLKFYAPIFFVGVSLHSVAQQNNQVIIAAAGDFSKGSDITLDWTLGEPVVESSFASGSLYTQGFHQPLLEVQRINYANNLFKNAFHVFPNPATSVLNITLDNSVKERLLVSLIDVNGRVLLNNTFPPEATALKLDVSRYTHGTYFLRITNKNGGIHSEFKVIKVK